MGTPNLNAIITHIKAQPYYKQYHLGVWNCRKIAGSSTWSQHSWGNAVDIMLPATWNRKAIGDAIKADLLATFGPHIRTLLWRVPDHYDHIHADLWPRGWSTPACAGWWYPNTIMTADGEILEMPFPLTIREEEELIHLTEQEQLLLKLLLKNLADQGSSVDFVDRLFPAIREGLVSQVDLDEVGGGVTVQEVINAIIDRLLAV